MNKPHSKKTSLLQLIANYSPLIAIGLALLVLIGWLFKVPLLIKPLPFHSPFNPLSAICFIGFGIALLIENKFKLGGFYARLLTIPPGLMGIIKLVTPDTDSYSILDSTSLYSLTHSLATLAASNFILCSIAVFLTTLSNIRYKQVANNLILLVLFSAQLSVVHHLFTIHTDSIPQTSVSMTFYSALGFVLISLSVLWKNQTVGFMGIFNSKYSGGRVARLIIPAAVVVPVIAGYTVLNYSNDETSAIEFNVCLLVTSITVIFYILTRFLADKLNQSDEKRIEAETTLKDHLSNLEEQIQDRAVALQRSELRFSATIEHGFELIIFMDEKLNIQYESPATRRVTGWNSQEIIKNGLKHYIHAEDIPTFNATLESIMHHPKVSHHLRLRVRHKQGHYIILDGNITNYLYDQTLKTIVVNLQDVTEQQKALENLNRSEQHFRSLIEHTFEAIYLLDNNLNIIYTSPSVTRITGRNYTKVNKCIEHTHPDDISLFQEKTKESFARPDSPVKIVFRCEHADGHYIWMEGMITSMLHDKNVEAIVVNLRDISDRKHAEIEASRKTLELEKQYKEVQDYKYAIDQSSIIAITDQRGIIKDVNDKFCEISKYSREELIGQDHRIVNSGYHSKEFIRNLWVTIANGKVWNGVIKNIAKDRSPYWVYTTIVPFLNKEGKPYQYLAIRSDITERKLTEEKLMQSEQQLKRTQTIAHMGGWEYSYENKIMNCSEEACRILGIVPDELPPLLENYINLIHPEDRDFVLHNIEQAEEMMQKFSMYHRILRKNGTVRTIYLEGNFEQNANQKTIKCNGVIHDVSERLSAEESLRRSEANLKTIIENATTAYILIDRNLNIISFNSLANQYTQNSLGRPMKEGGPAIEEFAPQRQEIIRQYFLDALDGKNIQYEVSLPDGEGAFVWYSTQIIGIPNQDGHIMGIILSTQDITQKKNMELQREQMTSDIIQHNKDLEQFAYIVSHNLRMPLANIMGFSAAIDDLELSDQEKNEFLTGILKSAEQLDGVVKDLNKVLQLRKEVYYQREKVSLSELIEQLETSISDILHKEKVTIHRNFAEADSLNTIRSYIYSIFLNLITNSIKYKKPDTSPVIDIRSELDGQQLVVRYKDNGSGIDMNRHGEKLFGLYKRFHPEIEGKGVGLFMLKTQVEALGGKVSATGAVNEGIEFTITLPI